MKDRKSTLMLTALFASVVLTSGCSSIRNWMGSDSGASRDGRPTASEVSELCDMQRRMATMSRDAQDAVLESHMRSAHGSSSPEGLRAHREMMLQKCTRT